MIISFSFKNHLSFRDNTTLSMVASREIRHRHRVSKIKKYQTRVLPITAIYGGNASGKTNFCAALGFARHLIVGGKPSKKASIPVSPFCLDAAAIEKPSRFTFVLLIDETIYKYSFAVTREAVLEEELIKITNTGENTLYKRDKHNEEEISFCDSLEKKNDLLQPAFKFTQENQLFLSSSADKGIEEFQPVYDWFENTLVLVGSNSSSNFENFWFLSRDTRKSDEFNTIINETLLQLDTGIARLAVENTLDKDAVPDEIKTQIRERLSRGEIATIRSSHESENILITLENGEFVSKGLALYHLKADEQEVKFKPSQESSGTLRVIDLLPIFADLANQATNVSSKKVYVIDEIDRSLHTLLTRRLLELYLNKCSEETRSQLLLTTHDVLLMDRKLLRRDELWVAERDASGSSKLHSFSDYKDSKNDQNIRKSYLQRRMGGIPHIL